jgi:hypothetical protein
VTAFVNDCKGKEDDGRETVLSFAKIVPVPDWAEEQDWYLAHWFLWGTKWDVEEPWIEEDDEWGDERRIKYAFTTAWSPPCAFVVRASRMYPDVTFCLTWEEPGRELGGRMVAREGEVASHRELVDTPYDATIGLMCGSLKKRLDDKAFLQKLDPILEFSEPVNQPKPVDDAPALALAT